MAQRLWQRRLHHGRAEGDRRGNPQRVREHVLGGGLIRQGGTTAPPMLQFSQPQPTDDRDPDPHLCQGEEPPGKPDGRQPPGDRGAA